MNKFFVSGLAIAGLVAVAAASQATELTYELLTPFTVPTGTTPFTTAPGLSGISADPSAPSSTFDSSLSNFFAAIGGSQTVTSTVPGSEIQVGADTTTPGLGTANTSTYFGSTAASTETNLSFKFAIDTGTSATGAGFHTFTVLGYLTGALGYGPTDAAYSDARLTLTSVSDAQDAGAVLTTGVTDPGDGEGAIELTTTINGTAIDVYVDTPLGKPFPGNTPSTLGGFIVSATSTPEPGSVAMIVGMGVSGGIFLRRKRRA
jgi:hypothetical protein